MSDSSLQRHLAAEGTSFQTIKDALRRDVAIFRLNTSDLPLGRLAADVGFSESSSSSPSSGRSLPSNTAVAGVRTMPHNRASLFCPSTMSETATKDIIAISRARARLTELADDVSKTGREKVFTKNGESYVALITAGQLDDLRRFREAEHLSKLAALVEAAEDIESGRVYAWDDFKPRLARLRAKARRMAAR